MFEEKHCDTCDCHLRVCGIQRHKIQGFLLKWACVPFLFVTVTIFVAKSYYNLQIPLFWLFLVALTVNWIWIVMELIIPCIEEIKLLAQGIAAWLLDMTCRFCCCFCFCCLYCYKEVRRRTENTTRRATTQTATTQTARYSLEHIVPESPNVSLEMYSNENPPPLPERQGKVGRKESPVVYDLTPRLKQQSTSTSDFERSLIKAFKDVGLSDTSPQTGHATVVKTQAGHISGATSRKTQAGRSSGATGEKTKTGHSGATGGRTQTVHTSGATGGRAKTSYVSVASCTSKESGNVRGACGTRTETGLRPQTNPTSRNLSATPQSSPSRNSGVITKTGLISSNLSTTLKTSPASTDLGISPKTSPTASSFGASPDVSPTGVSLGGRRKQTSCPVRCLFPDSKSPATTLGKTIDETEDIDNSICQIDLSHISVPISLPSSVSAGHSVHDSDEKDPSRFTVQLTSNQQAAYMGATQITTSSHVQQSVSSYIPFDPDTQPQKPIKLKDCENVDSSPSQSNSSQIKVPQVSPTDPARVRMSPQVSPTDPARVRVSPQTSPTDPERASPRVSPSHLTHMKMSFPCHKQEKISSLTFPNDHRTQERTKPKVQASDSTRLNTIPKIFDTEGARSILEVAGIRQSQSSYVPFVPDNIQLEVAPTDSDRSNISPIKINLSSERYETNIFTSSFGKTIDLTENIDDSILQLDASHIHVPILPRTEQTSSSQPLEPKFTSQTSVSGSPHLRTSPLASASGSPHLRTSPLASASGSPHLRRSPLASAPGSPHLRTSPLASASGSPHLRTSPLASAPGSPHLKTSPLASKPGSPYSKQSSLPSTSGSQNLKLSPQASSDSQSLMTIPLPSSSDSPPLMTSSPLMMRPVSKFGKLIHIPTFPLSRSSSPAPESVSPHRTSPKASAPMPHPVDETKNIDDPISICPLDLSHISVPISLPSSATAGHSVHDPFEKVHHNTSPQASDHLACPQTSSYVPYIPNQPGPTQSISRDACGVQSSSDGQNQEAITRTYTKFSIPSHGKKSGRENSVEGIDGGQSLAYLSSSGSSESIDLQGSKLRIRSTSEEYKVKNSVSESATTRRKTL